MATQGCYADVLQWHDVGLTENGLKILYKRYLGVSSQFDHQAEYDVALNRSFCDTCETGYILVIDVKHVRSVKNAVKYARCVNDLSDSKYNPVAVHVVNTSKIIKLLWKVVRKFLDKQSAGLVVFDHMEDTQFSCDAHRCKYASLCKCTPINK